MARKPTRKGRARTTAATRRSHSTSARVGRLRAATRKAHARRHPSPLRPRADVPRIVSVEILWSENSAVPHGTFRTLANADAALARAFTESPPPAGGAYDKTAFAITWSDGKRHEGRADIRAIDVANAPAAGGLLRHHLQIVGAAMRDARRTKWSWLTAEREHETNEWGTELLRRLAAEPKLASSPRNARSIHAHRPGVDRDSFRSGTLVFRAVGARGEPYPPWVQDLRGQSGVYVIRERQSDGSSPIVYVGESHTNRLYETLTRHFQSWRRYKGFWRGQYAEGHDPGLTYDRNAVEVAVVITPAQNAHAMEARLILRLRPRDNLLGQADADAPL